MSDRNLCIALNRNRNEAKPKTLTSFLQTAMLPLGKVMYVYGGGWNEKDNGAGTEAVTLGLSKEWEEFAAVQDASYDHTKYRYQIHKGLDCSGYVGWVLYNTFEKQSGCTGYVMPAEKMAESFAKQGFGTLISQGGKREFLPGDIVSMKGHVWISLGTCEDGSVLLVHASPPGVILCGTCLPAACGMPEQRGQAVSLAEKYMRKQFPCWYAKYPNCSRGSFYVTQSSVFRWEQTVLADPEGIRSRNPEDVLCRILQTNLC